MSSSLKTNEDPVSERKKLYISERQIPILFEALMAGLMNFEPDDHYDFIIDSLTKIKKQKLPIQWDTFIRMHDKNK
ncbi:unnamed protein product [Rotaria sp. Silwood2]|nr:unnamed protein product [Rotaria sp. Silwood2]CAF2472684.1 unnamed protein product [Rotaria sp. Silwood2]CAF2708436.1 unnamed protein product [Rotaria sp. Silwood2]CAF2859831.1 unnamed protein product [Rotaria sp. Silwood2]CAF3901401.1 unnamed protein product [Rotaria sp. Silwood2]